MPSFELHRWSQWTITFGSNRGDADTLVNLWGRDNPDDPRLAFLRDRWPMIESKQITFWNLSDVQHYTLSLMVAMPDLDAVAYRLEFGDEPH